MFRRVESREKSSGEDIFYLDTTHTCTWAVIDPINFQIVGTPTEDSTLLVIRTDAKVQSSTEGVVTSDSSANSFNKTVKSYNHTCSIHTDGRLMCAGDSNQYTEIDISNLTF